MVGPPRARRGTRAGREREQGARAPASESPAPRRPRQRGAVAFAALPRRSPRARPRPGGGHRTPAGRTVPPPPGPSPRPGPPCGWRAGRGWGQMGAGGCAGPPRRIPAPGRERKGADAERTAEPGAGDWSPALCPPGPERTSADLAGGRGSAPRCAQPGSARLGRRETGERAKAGGGDIRPQERESLRKTTSCSECAERRGDTLQPEPPASRRPTNYPPAVPRRPFWKHSRTGPSPREPAPQLLQAVWGRSSPCAEVFKLYCVP